MHGIDYPFKIPYRGCFRKLAPSTPCLPLDLLLVDRDPKTRHRLQEEDPPVAVGKLLQEDRFEPGEGTLPDPDPVAPLPVRGGPDQCDDPFPVHPFAYRGDDVLAELLGLRREGDDVGTPP